MEPAKSCMTNHWMSLDVTGSTGEDRISQLLSEAGEALAAKDTEDLEFEVVD